MTECEARRPERGDVVDCKEVPGRWQVVYRSRGNGRVLLRVAGCFEHCMAELERAEKAGTMARVDVEPRAEGA